MAISMSDMAKQLVADMQKPGSNWSRMMRGEELATGAEVKEPSRWDPRPDGRNVAHEHIPGYVTGFDPEDTPFDTIEELLNLPFVSRWTGQGNFHRFSISRDSYPRLMAELDGGLIWWVVATLDRDMPELPTWEAKYE